MKVLKGHIQAFPLNRPCNNKIVEIIGLVEDIFRASDDSIVEQLSHVFIHFYLSISLSNLSHRKAAKKTCLRCLIKLDYFFRRFVSNEELARSPNRLLMLGRLHLLLHLE